MGCRSCAWGESPLGKVWLQKGNNTRLYRPEREATSRHGGTLGAHRTQPHGRWASGIEEAISGLSKICAERVKSSKDILASLTFQTKTAAVYQRTVTGRLKNSVNRVSVWNIIRVGHLSHNISKAGDPTIVSALIK